MKNQVLSIWQMKSLAELGVDTSQASMCWIKNTDGDETENMYMLSVHNEWCYEMSCLSPVPTFTLQDIIKLLPDQIKGYGLSWYIGDGLFQYDKTNCCDGLDILHSYSFNENISILDVAYHMLVWVIDNKYLIPIASNV